MPRRPLLITRPQPAADAMVVRAQERGIKAYACPLFAPTAQKWQIPNVLDLFSLDPSLPDPPLPDPPLPDPPLPDMATTTATALMITSANAVRYAGPQLAAIKTLPAYAIGKATAQAARAVGMSVQMLPTFPLSYRHAVSQFPKLFDSVSPASPTISAAQRLVETITAEGYRHILWLCGRDHTKIVPPPALTLFPCPCYAIEPLVPSVLWWQSLRHPAVITLFSVRAAHRVADLCKERQDKDDRAISRAHLSLLALSPTIARAAGNGWNSVYSAPYATSESVLEIAAHLCQS